MVGTKLDLASGWRWETGVRAWTSRHQSFSSRQQSNQNRFNGPEALTRLFGEDRDFIQKKFGARNFEELASLAGETNSEMFYTGMLSFGQRLQDQGKSELAAEVYSAIVGAGLVSAPGHGGGMLDPLRPSNDLPAGGRTDVPLDPLQRLPGPPLQVADLAQKKLNAILGTGSTGLRAEILIKNFAAASADSNMIIPMLAGSVVAQSVRAATLGRLAGSTRAAWVTRGFGARFTAGFAGYAAEVPVFAMSARLLSDSNGSTVSADLQRAAVTLGALKIFGYGGNQAFLKLHGYNELGIPARLGAMAGFNRVFLPQASIFLGLMSAHKLEEFAGLRPHVDGATTVTDTLASMVSMSVGMHLGHGLLGPKFSQYQMELGKRADIFSKTGANRPGVLEKLQQLVQAPQQVQTADGPFIAGGMMMSSVKGGEPGAGKRELRLAPDPSPFPHRHKIAEEVVGAMLETEVVSQKPISNLPLISSAMRQALVDILVSSQEDQVPLKGSIAQQLRESKELRKSILGASRAYIQLDAASGKILELKIFEGDVVKLHLQEESTATAPPQQAKAGPVEAGRPAPEPKAKAAQGKTSEKPSAKKQVKSPPTPEPVRPIPGFSPLQSNVFRVLEASETEMNAAAIQKKLEEKGQMPEDTGSITWALRELLKKDALEVRSEPNPLVGFPDLKFYSVKKPTSSSAKPTPSRPAKVEKSGDGASEAPPKAPSRYERVGPHSLSPLQNAILEVLTASQKGMQTAEVLQALTDRKIPVSEGGGRQALTRLVNKGLIETWTEPNPIFNPQPLRFYRLKQESGSKPEVEASTSPVTDFTKPVPEEEAPAPGPAGTAESFAERVDQLLHQAILRLERHFLFSARRNLEALVSGQDANFPLETRIRLLEAYEVALQNSEPRPFGQIRTEILESLKPSVGPGVQGASAPASFKFQQGILDQLLLLRPGGDLKNWRQVFELGTNLFELLRSPEFPELPGRSRDRVAGQLVSVLLKRQEGFSPGQVESMLRALENWLTDKSRFEEFQEFVRSNKPEESGNLPARPARDPFTDTLERLKFLAQSLPRWKEVQQRTERLQQRIRRLEDSNPAKGKVLDLLLERLELWVHSLEGEESVLPESAKGFLKALENYLDGKTSWEQLVAGEKTAEPVSDPGEIGSGPSPDPKNQLLVPMPALRQMVLTLLNDRGEEMNARAVANFLQSLDPLVGSARRVSEVLNALVAEGLLSVREAPSPIAARFPYKFYRIRKSGTDGPEGGTPPVPTGFIPETPDLGSAGSLSNQAAAPALAPLHERILQVFQETSGELRNFEVVSALGQSKQLAERSFMVDRALRDLAKKGLLGVREITFKNSSTYPMRFYRRPTPDAEAVATVPLPEISLQPESSVRRLEWEDVFGRAERLLKEKITNHLEDRALEAATDFLDAILKAQKILTPAQADLLLGIAEDRLDFGQNLRPVQLILESMLEQKQALSTLRHLAERGGEWQEVAVEANQIFNGFFYPNELPRQKLAYAVELLVVLMTDLSRISPAEMLQTLRTTNFRKPGKLAGPAPSVELNASPRSPQLPDTGQEAKSWRTHVRPVLHATRDLLEGPALPEKLKRAAHALLDSIEASKHEAYLMSDGSRYLTAIRGRRLIEQAIEEARFGKDSMVGEIVELHAKFLETYRGQEIATRYVERWNQEWEIPVEVKSNKPQIIASEASSDSHLKPDLLPPAEIKQISDSPLYLHMLEGLRKPRPGEVVVEAKTEPGAGLLGLGSAIHAFSAPLGNAGAERRFQMSVILPGLDRIRFEVKVDARGALQVGGEGKGEWIAYRTGRDEEFQIEKIPNSEGRFRLVFKTISPPLELNLTSVRDRSNNIARLEIGPNQPGYSGALAPFFGMGAPLDQPVKILHSQLLASTTSRDGPGIQQRYALHLSNGDWLEILLSTGHHSRGRFALRSVRLHRLGSSSEEGVALKIIRGTGRGGSVRVVIEDPEQGYHFEIDCKFPTGSEDGGPIQWLNPRFHQAPAPIHLKLKGVAEIPVKDERLPRSERGEEFRQWADRAGQGDPEAIQRLGELGREQDSAYRELAHLYEIVTDPDLAPEFFGTRAPLVRGKVLEAIGTAAEKNPEAREYLELVEVRIPTPEALAPQPMPVAPSRNIDVVSVIPMPERKPDEAQHILHIEEVKTTVAEPRVAPAKPAPDANAGLRKFHGLVDRAARGHAKKALRGDLFPAMEAVAGGLTLEQHKKLINHYLPLLMHELNHRKNIKKLFAYLDAIHSLSHLVNGETRQKLATHLKPFYQRLKWRPEIALELYCIVHGVHTVDTTSMQNAEQLRRDRLLPSLADESYAIGVVKDLVHLVFQASDANSRNTYSKRLNDGIAQLEPVEVHSLSTEVVSRIGQIIQIEKAGGKDSSSQVEAMLDLLKRLFTRLDPAERVPLLGGTAISPIYQKVLDSLEN